ncbi:hypothetical protein [Citrobacter freundii]|uniref:hypothetical protein n=1 Tax=Citrobacter freundii TaxID=546 RepID=UPI0019051599|nr:hypothetical protein [Citrobacter freundii]MBJ8931575.1 hypothetical protein [Citrobacter freundii]
MNATSSTFFIQCSDVQASAALYALKLLKRCTYNKQLIDELQERPVGLYQDIFRETIAGNGGATTRFYLMFNFAGKFISADGKEGLLLSFFDRNDSGIYHFHQGAAICFCQALLKCFDAKRDVEIAHFIHGRNGYELAGAVNVSISDFEFLSNYPHLVFNPFHNDEPPEFLPVNLATDRSTYVMH